MDFKVGEINHKGTTERKKNGWFFSHDQARYLNPVKYAQKVSFIIVPHAFKNIE